ncbi:MAG: AIR synthase-related protein, partial [Dehalococcoidia bacterium]|nr:AIR synthase-related protein [Dehalococcoidia bacterium]
IQAGDVILGLPSSGLHTNGYSLVRKIFNLAKRGSRALDSFYTELGRTLGEELLEPHRCYYRSVKPLLSGTKGGGGKGGGRQLVKGMAHITGGGLIDNVVRILPAGVKAIFRPEEWPAPPIFTLIQERGNVRRDEMYHVFNMGVGMVLACSPGDADEIIAAIPEARLIGEVVKGGEGQRVIIS